MNKPITQIFLLILLITTLTNPAISQGKIELGKIIFKSSANQQAQNDFEKGVLLMHSFQYNPARLYFQKAEESDPNAVMAYWGEAMTYNHPIWNEEDLTSAQKVLKKLDEKMSQSNIKNLPPKDAGFIQAIHFLYGKGNKLERDLAYAGAMYKLYQNYPQDDEIATFYALSILGTSAGGRDFATYMRAAAILEEVFARNPHHPGAAHYLIHSYDDAIHAPLGLRPARVYAKIAPAASHALHMPSHIFLALGMWDDVIASNQAAWASGKNRREACENQICRDPAFLNDLSDDLHALEWLTYGYLQKQEYAHAFEAANIAKKFVQAEPSPLTKWFYTLMRDIYLSESQDWQADLKPVDLSNMSLLVQADDMYVNVMVALHNGSDEKIIAAMIDNFAKTIPKSAPITKTHVSYYTSITPNGIIVANIAVLEAKAQLKLKQGQTEEAIALLREASQSEDQMPLNYGPPYPIKPPHELLAEILSQDKQYAAAYKEYQNALKRAPHRKISEDGLIKLMMIQTAKKT